MLKKFHKVLGLSIGLIIIHLAITGIILMYPNTFKLYDTFLSNNYMLSLYNMNTRSEVFVSNDFADIGIVSNNIVISDYVLDMNMLNVLGLAINNKYIFAANPYTLLVIENDGYEYKIIKKLTFPFILKELVIDNNKEIKFLNNEGKYYSLDESFNFIVINKLARPIKILTLYSAQDQEADLYLNYIQGPGIQLLRFITDIHNGRFFGKIIMIIFSLSSLGAVFLAVTGTVMGLNMTFKRRIYKKKKKINK